MLVNFLLGIVGVLFFLFIFWERLNEDYSSDVIFQVATAVLAGIAVGLIAAKLFAPAWFFWISTLGALAGMSLMLVKFKLRFYETLEALFLAAMPAISIVFFKDSISRSALNSFLAFVGTLVLIFLAYWFDLNYKNFSWYKSGRIGFAGLAVAIIFFLARVMVVIFGFDVVSFVGRSEVLVSGLAALICTGLLINLGRKES
jgi:hypothetical protein